MQDVRLDLNRSPSPQAHLRRAERLYPIDMGRQKLTNSVGKATGKIREVEPTKAHAKRLKAAHTTSGRRGGEVSRESVNAHALATFGSPEKAQHWMNRPNPLFEGRSPAQVIEFNLVGVEAELPAFRQFIPHRASPLPCWKSSSTSISQRCRRTMSSWQSCFEAEGSLDSEVKTLSA
jgi:uncharacterized protein (DUF2384 family)